MENHIGEKIKIIDAKEAKRISDLQKLSIEQIMIALNHVLDTKWSINGRTEYRLDGVPSDIARIELVKLGYSVIEFYDASIQSVCYKISW
jgi:hypothetical protein